LALEITSIVKKEYYDTVFVVDLTEMTFTYYDGKTLSIVFKSGDQLMVEKHEKDLKNDLKKMSLDIYSIWNKYIQNVNMWNTTPSDEE
jgi:hypothetical protein